MDASPAAGRMPIMLVSCALLLVLISSGAPALAATITVPDNYASIQNAINAARPGDTVFVKAGTYRECIVVGKSIALVGQEPANTVIDGGGTAHSVIDVCADGVVIEGFTIKSGSQGVNISKHDHIVVKDNRIRDNYRGVMVADCSNITLAGNTVYENQGGIIGWTVAAGGISLSHSSNCKLRDNRMGGNSGDFSIRGDQLSHFTHDIDASNKVGRSDSLIGVKKVYYLVGQHNLDISPSTHPDLGFLALVDSSDIRVRGLLLEGCNPGLLLAYTTGSTVSDCVFRSCSQASIQLVGSVGNAIMDNTLSPNNGGGIRLEWQSNGNTISGNVMRDNLGGTGIHLERSSNNLIVANAIENMDWGICIWYNSDNNTLDGNKVTGTFTQGSDPSRGITIYNSTNSVLRNNEIDGFKYNFEMELGPVDVFRDRAPQLSFLLHDIDPSNTAGGRPIYYLMNRQDVTLDTTSLQGAGYLGLVNSTRLSVKVEYVEGVLIAYTNDSTVTGVRSSGNPRGIQLICSHNNAVSGCTLTYNQDGLRLFRSSNNTITDNVMTLNEENGIYLEESSGNTISGNAVTDTVVTYGESYVAYGNGIRLEYHCSDNLISDNRIEGNRNGIYIQAYSDRNAISGNFVAGGDTDGIAIWDYCLESTIADNTLVGNKRHGIRLGMYADQTKMVGNIIMDNGEHGIYLMFGHGSNVSGNLISGNGNSGLYLSSSNCTITGNIISDNSLQGIWIRFSSGGKIYHNNFIGNGLQVVPQESTATWDDGYPSGGNYWSDCAGIDLFGGPGQDIPGGDGIGDAPYVIDPANADRYPFHSPASIDIPDPTTTTAAAALALCILACSARDRRSQLDRLGVTPPRIAEVLGPSGILQCK